MINNYIKIWGVAPLTDRGVSYDYKRTKDNTLWNVGAVDGANVGIWTINGWGKHYEEILPVHVFMTEFEPYAKEATA